MASCDVALIREQGVEFAVVCVEDRVLSNPSERESAVVAWQSELGRPVTLMGAHRHETFGRSDIVRFLQNVNPSRLPWRRYTVS